MANQENLKPFTGADDPRRGKKPKGSIHLSTRIQKMLNDPEFTADLIGKDGKKIKFKGNPAEAIIRTAILKSMSGDKGWAKWLAENGYGSKLIHEIERSPIDEILDKYGLSNVEEDIKKEVKKVPKPKAKTNGENKVEPKPADKAETPAPEEPSE